MSGTRSQGRRPQAKRKLEEVRRAAKEASELAETTKAENVGDDDSKRTLKKPKSGKETNDKASNNTLPVEPQTQRPQDDSATRSPKVVAPRTRVVRMQRKGGRVVKGCDVYIGRRWTMGGWDLPQSKWANPFSVKKHAGGSVEKAVQMYEDYILKQPELMASLGELRGKVLGCWCKKKPSDPCHGDVLARLADQMSS